MNPTFQAHTRRSISPGHPGSVLKAAAVRPRRARGQNFLVQAGVAERIVTAAALANRDEVVEIGPGLGILSDRIAGSAVRRLTLVELEQALAVELEKRFSNDRRTRVVCADFLAIDLPALVAHPPVKIIGNLPFSTAAAMLRRLCGWHTIISRMVLMFQREVAERIRARSGDSVRSALSVFTELYWETGEHFRVLAGNFHPRPRVDAEVIVFRPRTPAIFATEEEPALLHTVRGAFNAPRKAIRNSLAAGLALDPRVAAGALADAGIDPASRAAELSTADFVRLTRALARLNLPPVVADHRDA